MNHAVLKKLIINIIGTAGMVSFSGFLQAASFDCARASFKTEKIICADESLSTLDDQLSAAYKTGLAAAGDKASFKQEQLSWLKTRNACPDTACLTQSYQTRLAVLGGVSATAKTKDRKIVTFTLLEGEGYPLCKEYVEMLNKTQYTEMPACSRKILPEFKNFQNIAWVEITDKEEMIKITKERMAIQAALNPTHSKQMYDPINRIKPITENRLKMYSYKMQINADGTMDVVYRNHVQPKHYENKYGHCSTVDSFYIGDSEITAESIEKFSTDPYKAFNFTGSNELFIYGGNLYVSIYQGTSYHRTNLDIYGVGNKKVCGILAK